MLLLRKPLFVYTSECALLSPAEMPGCFRGTQELSQLLGWGKLRH
jgi:hypothetical protein